MKIELNLEALQKKLKVARTILAALEKLPGLNAARHAETLRENIRHVEAELRCRDLAAILLAKNEHLEKALRKTVAETASLAVSMEADYGNPPEPVIVDGKETAESIEVCHRELPLLLGDLSANAAFVANILNWLRTYIQKPTHLQALSRRLTEAMIRGAEVAKLDVDALVDLG